MYKLIQLILKFKRRKNLTIFFGCLAIFLFFFFIYLLIIKTELLRASIIILLSILSLILYYTLTFEFLAETANKFRLAKEIAQSKLKKYTFLELDKQLISSIRQYLVFFSNYVKDSKKVDITMHASEVEGGLDIAFDFPETTTKEELQAWLNEYLGFLTADKNRLQVNTVEEVTDKEADVLILKLKNEIQHFKHSLEILQVENSLLKSHSEQVYDITKLIASKSDQIFISAGSNSPIIKEQRNTTDKTQFIASTFNKSQINISEIDDTIVDLIKTYAENSREEKKLLFNLETLQSAEASDKKKKKSGSMIRKFLETCNTEVAKEVIQTISENGEGWIKYMTNLF